VRNRSHAARAHRRALRGGAARLVFADGIYRFGEWNTIRIEARGPKLRIWLNGKPTVDYEDQGAMRIPRGFFGLQVHTTNNTALHGKEVLFRRLRVQPLD
jgi:hypothetical protein